MRAAIVIGATSGIGRAVAVRLAAAGYRVGIAGRREELLRELAQTMPDRYETEVLDVEDTGVCERLEKLVERLGSPELILFCAGTGELNDALDYRLEEATNQVNVAGFTRVMDWAYRYFEQRGGGCLAAITSVMGLRQPNGSLLCRVESLSDQLFGRVAPKGLLSKVADSDCRSASGVGPHGDDERGGALLDRFDRRGRTVYLQGDRGSPCGPIRYTPMAYHRPVASVDTRTALSPDVAVGKAVCRRSFPALLFR